MKATNPMDHRGIMTGSNSNNNNSFSDDDNDDSDDGDKSIGTVLDEFVSLLVGDENNYFGDYFLGCFCSQAQQQQQQLQEQQDDDDNYARYGNAIRSCDSSITSVGTNITGNHHNNKYGRFVGKNRVIIDDDAHLLAR